MNDWWPKNGRGRAIAAGCLVIAAAYLAKAIVRGLSFTQGDFYFTMPGEYARRLNPALWNSPDMQVALHYNHGQYYYGPSQYLTLFPVVFFDSYERIATALLAIYPFVLLAACAVLWKMLKGRAGQAGWMAAAILALVFAFLPLTQSLVQREFEVVAFLALVAACALAASGREAAAGVAVAYLTWFKYWPIALLGSFVLHRRVKGLAAFAGASAALVLAAQLVFGLDHFIIGKTLDIVGGLMRPLGGGEVLHPVIARGAQKADFCRQWVWGRGTEADVRWALCGVEDRWPWLSARAVFGVLVAATGALFAWGAVTLERRRADTETVKWATIWEFSILTMAGVSFVHAHYYYYIVFLLPLVALFHWYVTRPQPGRALKIALWAVSYVLLNALLVPTSWLSTLLRGDAWQVYLDSGLCLLGTLLLLGLVLWEFVQLTRRAPAALAA
ncbi:MAG: glycosyltransferase 87 family protein [Acidobacteriia bacterium]|nr:glycosyltransferase 87 family protein [Terriglobia bacterium]